MKYTGERMVPWQRCGEYLMHHHIMRYAFATQFCYGKKVYDLGCGAGYGSHILSLVANEVYAVDVDMKAILFGKKHFSTGNILWINYALEHLNLPIDSDINICFEVLEHLDDPSTIINKFKPMLWSMPVNDASRFHKRGYSVSEIDELTGGGRWFQSSDGLIVERDEASKTPVYVLGLTTKEG